MKILPLPNIQLDLKTHLLDLSIPQVMGILNVTPDSFSDGGKYHQRDQAIIRAEQMIQEGASIIDIGGESTRPNAQPICVDQELERVIPVVERLADYPITLSIDTSQPEVIRHAIQTGAHIWNDVRALSRPNALKTAAELQIPVILMHMRGEPNTMNQLAHYQHCVEEVKTELQQRIDVALQQGIQPKHILLDVGFGFAKNTQHNLQLLHQLWQFHEFGFPLVSGLSRKRFIGDVLNQTNATDRTIGSVVGHLLSIQQGASIVRVHDVKATVEAIKLWQAVQHS